MTDHVTPIAATVALQASAPLASSGTITFIVIAICAGVILAALYNFYIRRVPGSVVRLLLSRGALSREITRTLVRVGVQAALIAVAENASDWRTQTALRATQLGVAAWAASCTAADVRSWTALPKRVMAVRLDRPADGVVQVVADGQSIPVTVPPGNSLVFIRKAAPSAVPSVKIATFR